jgi:hypothetical protein
MNWQSVLIMGLIGGAVAAVIAVGRYLKMQHTTGGTSGGAKLSTGGYVLGITLVIGVALALLFLGLYARNGHL